MRVKRKGQATLPDKVRRRYEIEEGDPQILEASDPRTTMLRVKKPPGPGRPVGSKEQKKILAELEKLRKKWR